jgi:hypothetical protein
MLRRRQVVGDRAKPGHDTGTVGALRRHVGHAAARDFISNRADGPCLVRDRIRRRSIWPAG